MFNVNNRHQNHIIDCVMSSCRDVVLVSLLITNFTPCSSVSIVNFEQANAGWGKYLWHKGLIKSFAFTRIFPGICAMRLIVVFLQVLSFIYVKTRGNN